jgi:hypothetical protein
MMAGGGTWWAPGSSHIIGIFLWFLIILGLPVLGRWQHSYQQSKWTAVNSDERSALLFDVNASAKFSELSRQSRDKHQQDEAKQEDRIQ